MAVATWPRRAGAGQNSRLQDFERDAGDGGDQGGDPGATDGEPDAVGRPRRAGAGQNSRHGDYLNTMEVVRSQESENTRETPERAPRSRRPGRSRRGDPDTLRSACGGNADVEYHDLGDFDTPCHYCTAVLMRHEVKVEKVFAAPAQAGRRRRAIEQRLHGGRLCCQQGRVYLDRDRPMPDLFRRLFWGRM